MRTKPQATYKLSQIQYDKVYPQWPCPGSRTWRCSTLWGHHSVTGNCNHFWMGKQGLRNKVAQKFYFVFPVLLSPCQTSFILHCTHICTFVWCWHIFCEVCFLLSFTGVFAKSQPLEVEVQASSQVWQAGRGLLCLAQQLDSSDITRSIDVLLYPDTVFLADSCSFLWKLLSGAWRQKWPTSWV